MEPTRKSCVLMDMPIAPPHRTPAEASEPSLASPKRALRTLAGSFAGDRFQFRPFKLSDITRLAAIACEYRVDVTSIGVPHPYTTEFARMWSRAATAKENTQSLHWAVTKVGDSRLLGYAALNSIDLARRQAELRVWAACTAEHPMAAAGWSQHLLRFSFERVGLKRVYALQLARHPAAGQLLESIGMHPVG